MLGLGEARLRVERRLITQSHRPFPAKIGLRFYHHDLRRGCLTFRRPRQSFRQQGLINAIGISQKLDIDNVNMRLSECGRQDLNL